LPDKAAACAFAAGIVISKLNDSEYRWAQKETKQNKTKQKKKKKERKGKRKKTQANPGTCRGLRRAAAKGALSQLHLM